MFRYDQRRCQRESYRRHRTTTQPVTEEDDYYNGDDDDELTPDPEPDNQSGSQYGRGGYVNVAAKSKSDCPIENGVVRTSWGAVAVGPLLAGMNLVPFFWTYEIYIEIILDLQVLRPVLSNKM